MIYVSDSNHQLLFEGQKSLSWYFSTTYGYCQDISNVCLGNNLNHHRTLAISSSVDDFHLVWGQVLYYLKRHMKAIQQLWRVTLNSFKSQLLCYFNLKPLYHTSLLCSEIFLAFCNLLWFLHKMTFPSNLLY